MLSAFTSCCNRTPRFKSSDKKTSQSASCDATVELVLPTISSFKAHHQNVSCLKLFTIFPKLEKLENGTLEDPESSSTTCDTAATSSDGEVTLATCSESIKLFELKASCGSVPPFVALSKGHDRDIKYLTG